MIKRYKMEFVLGLTGAIAGTAAFIYVLIKSLQEKNLLFLIIIAAALMMAAFILGFVGAGLLNANKKIGGVVLIISALMSLCASILSFTTAFTGLLVFPLTMLPGVLALAKRTPSGNAPFGQTYVNSFDGLK